MDDVSDEGMKLWFIERLSRTYKFSPVIAYAVIKLTCDYVFIKELGVYCAVFFFILRFIFSLVYLSYANTENDS